MTTGHYSDRLHERMTESEAKAYDMAIRRLAASMPDSRAYAVHVASVPTARGTFIIHPDGTGPSNGTELYAIIRNRHIVTVMWRRLAQPRTPDAFRVDTVGRMRIDMPL